MAISSKPLRGAWLGNAGNGAWILAAALAGGAAGSSVVGLVFVGTAALAIAAVFFPLQAAICSICIRPLIDVFWYAEVLASGGIAINAQSILGAIIPPAILLGLLRDGWKPKPSPVILLAGLYGVVCLWDVWVAPSRGVALGDFGRLALPLVFVALGEHLATTGLRPMRLAAILALYSVVAVATGVMQIAGFISPREGAVTSSGELTRLTGLYHHPLDLAWRSAISLPFALMLARSLEGRLQRVTMYGWAAVCTIIAFASLARVAFVATTVQVAMWLWKQGRRRSVVVAVLLTAMAASLFSPVRIAVEQAIRPVVEGKYYELGTGRGLLFVAQARAFLAGTPIQKVLGHGLHTSPGLTVEYNPIPFVDLGGPESIEGQLSAHNQFLRPLVESGIVGAVSLLLIFVGGFAASQRLTTVTLDPHLRELGVAVGVLFTGFAVYSLSSQPLDRPPITWPLWAVLGYVTQVVSKAAAMGPSTPNPDGGNP